MDTSNSTNYSYKVFVRVEVLSPNVTGENSSQILTLPVTDSTRLRPSQVITTAGHILVSPVIVGDNLPEPDIQRIHPYLPEDPEKTRQLKLLQWTQEASQRRFKALLEGEAPELPLRQVGSLRRPPGRSRGRGSKGRVCAGSSRYRVRAN